jgi:hypothetical protein
MNPAHPHKSRRNFIKQTILTGTAITLLPRMMTAAPGKSRGVVLKLVRSTGLAETTGESYLENSTWYTGDEVGDGLFFEFPEGLLAGKKFITTDMLAEGNHMVKFLLTLKEGKQSRTFRFVFGVLNQCSLRVRLPLSLVDQNRWAIDREGAFLKPRSGGDRVDLEKVDRMTLSLFRKSRQTARFCITDVVATEEDVSLIEHPVLPRGKLIDEMGQSTIHQWKGRTKSPEELKSHLQDRFQNCNHSMPDHFSDWGGWKKKKTGNPTGFFTTHKDENRWWLVDPEGYVFWSAGVDCVLSSIDANVHLLEDALAFKPPRQGEFSDIYNSRGRALHMNYLGANLIRAFGQEEWKEKWSVLALDELKRLRFNTVGNWSEWEYASSAGVPYVRPMGFAAGQTGNVYRDFPDVFHPDFENDAARYARVLKDTAEDPAMIGYFMMNEPKWAFSSELPAAGMLYNTEECSTRDELARFLRKKYSDEGELASAWQADVNFQNIRKGRWQGRLTGEATVDLEAFSEIMVEKYFRTLSEACKKVDPNHLNLGIRYAGVPPEWTVRGMKSFDVFSMNCYRQKVPFEDTEKIHDLLQMPVIIGEWHFGALDVGLPSSGIGHVHTQKDRGKAYRVYLEDAAANPYCVGVHWFTLYDQSALGRFDGENYNIGFLDICHRPHEPLCNAAIKSHELVYEVADGTRKPYSNAPEYLPNLF